LNRSYLFLWCAAAGILAYLALDFHQQRNAPDYRKFERWWADDVAQLEASPKLPKPWFDVREVEVYGGTPESKSWLREIHIPLGPKNLKGQHKLEVLVVPWEEEGKTGVMLQYNLVDLKSKNMIFELGRTMVFEAPEPQAPPKAPAVAPAKEKKK
jgi:hypothetical protein